MIRQSLIFIVAFLLTAPVGFAAGQPISTDSIIVAATAAWNVTDSYLHQTASRDVTTLDAGHRKDLDALRSHGERIKQTMRQIIEEGQYPTDDLYWIRNENADPKPNPHLIDLFNKAALSEFALFSSARGEEMSGYPALKQPEDNLEFQLADTLTKISNLLANRLYSFALDQQILKDEAIHTRFERKLMKGFPAAPWEYMLNLHGNADGPASLQIIWLHPGTGVELLYDDLKNNTWKFQPVLTLQPLGINGYFLGSSGGLWAKINYLGLAGLLTYNSPSRDINAGGVVHFGNYLSVGATFGNDQTYGYASSAEAVETVKNLLGRGILLVGKIL
jgi:hypothetical protein